MTGDALYYRVALQFIDRLGPTAYEKLLRKTGKTPEELFNLPKEELTDPGFPLPGMGQRIAAFDGFDEVERQLARAAETGTAIIPIDDPAYPVRLKETAGAPFILHVRGELLPRDEAAVAMVGTRSPSPYGRQVTARFAAAFAERGVTVVSGMARGVDTVAHTAALKAGGRTVAVLGCGADVVYPPENSKLFDAIIENGAVISEYYLGAEPDARHFPRRNRIISALSLGTVVTEAPERSGALITTRYARKQGRPVFGVPGPVTDRRSNGPHGLIREGAALAAAPEQVLEALRIAPCPAGTLPADAATTALPVELSDDEHAVFARLSPVPVHVDELAGRLERPVPWVLAQLLPLELKGLAAQQAGKMFCLAPGAAAVSA